MRKERGGAGLGLGQHTDRHAQAHAHMHTHECMYTQAHIHTCTHYLHGLRWRFCSVWDLNGPSGPCLAAKAGACRAARAGACLAALQWAWRYSGPVIRRAPASNAWSLCHGPYLNWMIWAPGNSRGNNMSCATSAFTPTLSCRALSGSSSAKSYNSSTCPA